MFTLMSDVLDIVSDSWNTWMNDDEDDEDASACWICSKVPGEVPFFFLWLNRRRLKGFLIEE